MCILLQCLFLGREDPNVPASADGHSPLGAWSRKLFPRQQGLAVIRHTGTEVRCLCMDVRFASTSARLVPADSTHGVFGGRVGPPCTAHHPGGYTDRLHLPGLAVQGMEYKLHSTARAVLRACNHIAWLRTASHDRDLDRGPFVGRGPCRVHPALRITACSLLPFPCAHLFFLCAGPIWGRQIPSGKASSSSISCGRAQLTNWTDMAP